MVMVNIAISKTKRLDNLGVFICQLKYLSIVRLMSITIRITTATYTIKVLSSGINAVHAHTVNTFIVSLLV